MLVYYAVTCMGCFDDYLDASPRAKTMRGNGITTFILHFAQCITFNQTKFVTATIISEARLKWLYSRLGFKVIKYFATSPNFEKARKQFNYESGNSKALHKQKMGLQCYLTIQWRVTIIHDNRIFFNENRYMAKDLNEVPSSDYCLPYEYIDAEVNKKLENSFYNLLWRKVPEASRWALLSMKHSTYSTLYPTTPTSLSLSVSYYPSYVTLVTLLFHGIPYPPLLVHVSPPPPPPTLPETHTKSGRGVPNCCNRRGVISITHGWEAEGRGWVVGI